MSASAGEPLEDCPIALPSPPADVPLLRHDLGVSGRGFSADEAPPGARGCAWRSTLFVTGPVARTPAKARSLPTRFTRARRWSRGEQDSAAGPGTCVRLNETPARWGMTALSTMASDSLLPGLGNQRPIRADPSGRRDGRCSCCGGERPEVAVKNGDPFCSTGCARRWHDQLGSPSPSTGG
jgi:hypothetical protein